MPVTYLTKSKYSILLSLQQAASIPHLQLDLASILISLSHMRGEKESRLIKLHLQEIFRLC